MTRAILSLVAGVVALAVTKGLLVGAVPRAPLRRTNYRGISVASGMGIAVVAGVAVAVAVTGLAYQIDPSSRLLGAGAVTAVPLLALVLGFGILGLFDDLSTGEERGFRDHVVALRSGRVTSGAVKLLGGAAVAVAVAAPESTSVGWALANGALIALTANVFNGLDVRPGRAAKAFLLAATPLVVLAARAGSATVAAGIGAVAAFLPDDLKERAMLGDAGANAIGALVGGAIVYAEPRAWIRLVLLGLMLGLNVLADRPGFSRGIDAVGALRAVDRAGRVPEQA